MPALSVVIPSVNGWTDLRASLESLRDSMTGADAVPLEILVVDRVGTAVRDRVRSEFPQASLINVAPSTTIPDMRAKAIAVARAPLVAILEDHVQVPRGWARAIIDAQTRYGGVVAGTVYNAATARVVDWAAFFCEYSRLLPPLAAGRADWLTGNNTVYPRDLLDAHRAAVQSGRWEDYLHRELRSAGVPLTSCPDIAVAHEKHYTVREYFAQRYWYARSFAGERLAGRPPLVRLAYAGAALAGLPLLLWVRTVGRAWRSRLHRGTLVRTLPLISLFVCAWAVGEAVGSAFGPGDSLSRVC